MLRLMVMSGLLLCAFVGSAGISAASAESERLVLLTEENPPFNYRDPTSGEIVGSSVELVHEIMKAADIDYEIQMLPWRRAFRLAQEQENTCLFSMNFTAERKPLFKWVTPIYRGGWAFYKKADQPYLPEKEADIQGGVLVAQTAAGAIAELKTMEGVQVIEVGTEDAAYELLMRGRADFWLAGLLGASHVINDHKKSEEIRLVMHWRPAEVGMGCSPGTDDALMVRMKDANHQIGDRRYAIIQRHF